MFRKVKKLLKNGNEKKKDKKSRSPQAPSDDELFIDKRRFVLAERYKILWEYLMNHGKRITIGNEFIWDSIRNKKNQSSQINFLNRSCLHFIKICLIAPNADGIFRVPGSQPRIRALKLLIDSRKSINTNSDLMMRI